MNTNKLKGLIMSQDKPESEKVSVEKARKIVTDGPKTLDAKWLDPECWDGCQSLVYKAERDACLKRLGENDEEIMGLRAEVESLKKALSTTPVKGWVNVGELEKTIGVLAFLEGYLHPKESPRGLARVKDELTRLQALIEKEK
jgi:hypothetical protein